MTPTSLADDALVSFQRRSPSTRATTTMPFLLVLQHHRHGRPSSPATSASPLSVSQHRREHSFSPSSSALVELSAPGPINLHNKGNTSEFEPQILSAADEEDECRPSTRVRPPTAFLAAKRKRLAHKSRPRPLIFAMNLTSDRGGHERGEMSPNPTPHDFASSGKSDLPPRVEEPAEAANVQNTTNVGPDCMNPDELPEANVDLGSGGVDPTIGDTSSPVSDFFADYLDEDSLFAGLPAYYSAYDSSQIDAHFPGDIFSEPLFPKNSEGGPSEGVFVETDPVEPTARPTMPVDTSTSVITPLPPVESGGGGPSSQFHVLVKELLSDNDPEKIVLCIELRSFFSFVNAMIGKLFHGGLFFRQFKPFLDPRVDSIKVAGYPDLARAIADDLDCLEHELQMFRELRDAGASSFIAVELDIRLQSSREARILAELEIQMQRDRVAQVETGLAIRLSSLVELDSSITSCETQIDQLRRELREKEETLGILQMTRAQDQQTCTALSDESKSLKQKLVETEKTAMKTSTVTEESIRAELRQAYDDKLSKISQQIFSHGLDV